MRACGSISVILTAHGNAAPTKTLTDCCASTSPKGPISAFTAPTKLQPWPPPSTRGPERRLIGRRPQRRLTSFSYQPTKTVLRRPLESALWPSSGSGGEPQQPAKTCLASKNHPVDGGGAGHERDHAQHWARQIRRMALAGTVHAGGRGRSAA